MVRDLVRRRQWNIFVVTRLEMTSVETMEIVKWATDHFEVLCGASDAVVIERIVISQSTKVKNLNWMHIKLTLSRWNWFLHGGNRKTAFLLALSFFVLKCINFMAVLVQKLCLKNSKWWLLLWAVLVGKVGESPRFLIVGVAATCEEDGWRWDQELQWYVYGRWMRCLHTKSRWEVGVDIH